VDSKNYLNLVRQMYAHPKLYGFFNEDEISDALHHFRGRIEGIIDRAEKESRTREAYLLSSMRFVAKSVHRQNFSMNLCENAYVYSHFSEDTVFGPPADAFIEENRREESIDAQGVIGLSPQIFLRKLTPERKRLLYLVMKCSWDIDEELLKKCSFALGVPEQYLFNLVELAKRKTEGSRKQIYELNAKLNTLWIRLRVLELRQETSLIKSEKDCIACSANRCRQRYIRLLEKRKRRKSLVSNECISELLGIPKGSVDSGLFYLRKKIGSGQTLADYRKLG
jgi:hypothetical protein